MTTSTGKCCEKCWNMGAFVVGSIAGLDMNDTRLCANHNCECHSNKSTIRERAREEIMKCKDKCYSTYGRNASNDTEGDYGTWNDWEDLLVNFASQIEEDMKRRVLEILPDLLSSDFIKDEFTSGQHLGHNNYRNAAIQAIEKL